MRLGGHAENGKPQSEQDTRLGGRQAVDCGELFCACSEPRVGPVDTQTVWRGPLGQPGEAMLML